MLNVIICRISDQQIAVENTLHESWSSSHSCTCFQTHTHTCCASDGDYVK